MIKNWQVNNFKSIRKMDKPMELAQLTILTGTNSSGKSSLLQSMLLTAQTMNNKDSIYPPILLNGPLVRLGKFDEIKNKNSESNKPIEISISRQEYDIFTYDIFTKENNKENNNTCRISASFFSESQVEQTKPKFDITINYNNISAKDKNDKTLYNAQLTIQHSKMQHERTEEEWRGLAPGLTCRYEMHKDLYDYFCDNFQSKPKLDKLLEYDVFINDDLKHILREQTKLSLDKPVMCLFDHFLPKTIVFEIDIIDEIANILTNILTDENYDFSHYDNRIVPNVDYNFYEDLYEGPYFTEEIWNSVKTILKSVVTTISLDEVFQNFEVHEVMFDYKDGECIYHNIIFCKQYYNCLLQLTKEYRDSIYVHFKSQEKDLKEVIKKYLKDSPYILNFNNIDFEDLEFYHSSTKFIAIDLPRECRNRSSNLKDSITSIKYMGPLRDPPKSLYPLSPLLDTRDVGLLGENTAAVLQECQTEMINYISPKTLAEPQILVEMDGYYFLNYAHTQRNELRVAVNDWLQYLEAANKVETEDCGKDGYRLFVYPYSKDDANTKQDLTNVGTGVSQVLPIVVMGLLAPEGSTLIFEQPELHLHPKVQSLLADFFISLSLSGKQCIVETHSEYIIDKLRYRIASDLVPDGSMQVLSKIYFAQKIDGNCEFKEIKINRFGVMSDWPEGFFDESMKIARDILLASEEKKETERKNSNEEDDDDY
ncbi:hypothetical protein AGMMS50212_05480 [Spirochaetia bacterium]|nr:hypothetical protein AGMMS50212_05480 [Spirochaetia bacterium]